MQTGRASVHKAADLQHRYNFRNHTYIAQLMVLITGSFSISSSPVDTIDRIPLGLEYHLSLQATSD